MTRTLKVCFMIDCTSSMGIWIDAAKKKIKNTIDDIKDHYKDFKVLVSLIGYRDFGDKMFRVDFTDDILVIYYTLIAIEASGGKDAAEDVSGAYSWATCLIWDADVNLLLHIADAPDHGTVYHDSTVSDNYPHGHPLIDLLEEVRDLAITHVDVTLFRLNNSTDIMYNMMRKEYLKIRNRGFTIIDLECPNLDPETSFYSEVVSQIETSIIKN